MGQAGKPGSQGYPLAEHSPMGPGSLELGLSGPVRCPPSPFGRHSASGGLAPDGDSDAHLGLDHSSSPHGVGCFQ